MNCSTCPSREHVLLVWVYEINPMGQVSGQMLTLAQAKHCWIQCVAEVSGLLCADIKYFEKNSIRYSATLRLKQLMMFFLWLLFSSSLYFFMRILTMISVSWVSEKCILWKKISDAWRADIAPVTDFYYLFIYFSAALHYLQ